MTIHNLLLLRHAKSRWDEPGLDDHDRGLAPRGERAAAAIGALFRELDLRPDLVLCSTAVRAVDTWSLVAAAWPAGLAATPVRQEAAIYLAAPARLLALLRDQGGPAGSLVLVGHDPGIHLLATCLVGAGDATARRRLDEKYPTGALAWIELELDAWSDLEPGLGRLVSFHRPRDQD